MVAVNQKPLKPGTRTVVVGCKIPNGIWLQLERPITRMEGSRDGTTREVTYNVKTGPRYFINGPAYPIMPPKGFPKAPEIESGFAFTRGIPADVWEQWAQQKKDYPPLKNGLIFAFPDAASAVDAAQEREKELSGLEPLSTDVDARGNLVDPRIPKPARLRVGPRTDSEAA